MYKDTSKHIAEPTVVQMCVTTILLFQMWIRRDYGNGWSRHIFHYGENNSKPELSQVHQAKYKHDHKEQLEPGSSLNIVSIAI